MCRMCGGKCIESEWKTREQKKNIPSSRRQNRVAYTAIYANVIHKQNFVARKNKFERRKINDIRFMLFHWYRAICVCVSAEKINTEPLRYHLSHFMDTRPDNTFFLPVPTMTALCSARIKWWKKNYTFFFTKIGYFPSGCECVCVPVCICMIVQHLLSPYSTMYMYMK